MPPPPGKTYADGRRSGIRAGIGYTLATLAAAALVAVAGAGIGHRLDEAARIREAEQVAERVRLYLDCVDKTDGIEADPYALCGRRFAIDPHTMRPVSLDEAARIGTVSK